MNWCDQFPNKGTLLFDGNAKEALDKVKEASEGELKLKDNVVTWEVLEGDVEKEVMKKIIEAQQESFNRSKGRGKYCFEDFVDLKWFSEVLIYVVWLKRWQRKIRRQRKRRP